MRFLLDQGLPRSTRAALATAGHQAEHVAELGLARATDAAILDAARDRAAVVVTLDADFHMLLALNGALGPSVIRIRIEGLKGPALARLIGGIAERLTDEIQAGAAVTATTSGVRLRKLPIP